MFDFDRCLCCFDIEKLVCVDIASSVGRLYVLILPVLLEDCSPILTPTLWLVLCHCLYFLSFMVISLSVNLSVFS